MTASPIDTVPVARNTAEVGHTFWSIVGWWAVFGLWLSITVGLPATAETLNLVTLNGLPLGFNAVAQGGPVFLAALGLWVTTWSTFQMQADMQSVSRLDGLCLAGLVLGPATLIFVVARIYDNGFDGLLVGHAIMAGIVLWLLLIARPRPHQAPGDQSNVDQLTRDDQLASDHVTNGALATLLAIAMLPLVVSHLDFGALVAGPTPISGISRTEIMIAIGLAGVLGAVFSPYRWTLNILALVFVGLTSVLVVVAFANAITYADRSATGIIIPQLTYGYDVSEISRLQRDLVVAELTDPVTTRMFTRPWTDLSALNGHVFLLAVAAAAAAILSVGSATIASHASPSQSADELDKKVFSGLHWMILFSVLAVTIAPTLASQVRHTFYAQIEQGIEKQNRPNWMMQIERR
ncbi:MAG: hypothetical protein AAFO75_07960, partial [Pseudomonadota bacterium]